MKTEDGGITWNELESFTEEILKSVYFVDESNGWIVSLQGSIFHTSDGGNNWELQAFYQNSLLSGVIFTDLLNGYISGDGKIYKWHITKGFSIEEMNFVIGGNCQYKLRGEAGQLELRHHGDIFATAEAAQAECDRRNNS